MQVLENLCLHEYKSVNVVIHSQWLRLDDLLEQERNVKTAMTNRAGVLGLMLHQTIDHSLMRQVPSHQQADAAVK